VCTLRINDATVSPRSQHVLRSEKVEVYVLDTGVSEHNQFEDRLSCGHDYGNGDCGDTNGHGTHVAAIVGVSCSRDCASTLPCSHTKQLLLCRDMGTG
jgi:hypothetical protein